MSMEFEDGGVRFAVFADEVSAVARGVDDFVGAALTVLEFVYLTGAGAALNGNASGYKVADLE